MQSAPMNLASQVGLLLFCLAFILWLYCLLAARIPRFISGFEAMAWLDIERTREPTAYWMVMAGFTGTLLYFANEIKI